MKPVRLLLPLLLLLSGIVTAQLPQVLWTERFGNLTHPITRGGRACAPLPMPDGGFLIATAEVAANHPGPVANGVDLVITRLDSLGIVMWKKNFGGTRTEGQGGYQLARANDGNFLFITTTTSAGNGVVPPGADIYKGDVWIGKFDAQGSLLDSKLLLSSSTYDYYMNLVPLGDSTGYLLSLFMSVDISGNTAGSPITICPGTSIGSNILYTNKLLRLDNNFNVVRQQCLPQVTEGNWFALLPATRTGYLLFNNGSIRNPPGLSSCTIIDTPWVAMIDDTFGVRWKRPLPSYGLPHANYFMGPPQVLQAGPNRFIVPLQNGNTCITNSPDNMQTIISIDTLGDLQWMTTLPGQNEGFTTPADAGDGNSFLVTRGGNSYHYAEDSIALMRFDYANGNLLASQFYDINKPHPVSPLSDLFDFRLVMSARGQLYFWGLDQPPATAPFTAQPAPAFLFGRLGSVNVVTGRVFVDQNSNGIFDGIDVPMSGIRVTASKPGARDNIDVSDTNGLYAIDTEAGTYSLSLPASLGAGYTIVASGSPSTHAGTGFIDTVHFALRPIPGAFDASVDLWFNGTARPGFALELIVATTNNTYANASAGTVRVIKPANTIVTGGNRTPVSSSGDTLLFNYTNLQPLQRDTIRIQLEVAAPPTVNIGDTLRARALVLPGQAQTNYRNDSARVSVVTRGSYDPNDKREHHGGYLSTTQLAAGESFQYTIRFQNTGNYPAATVVVRDTLPAGLDPASIEMVASSHPYFFAQRGAQVLEWTFANINLADSVNNEPASHGYLSFRIRPTAGYASGDTVRNSAAIYFDYNPPVITNRDQTVLFTEVATALPRLGVTALSVLAVPNPARTTLQLVVQSDRRYAGVPVEIRGMNGSLVAQLRVSLQPGQNLVTLPVDRLPAASYLVRMQAGGQWYVSKIVKQR